MNFGLTILAVFYIIYLIVPGVFFKRFYFQSKFGKEFNAGAFADKLITSVFWGLIIQILVLLIIKATFELSYDDIYNRCRNIYSDIHSNSLPKVSAFQLKALLAMFLASMALSCLLGFFLHHCVRLLKLDIRFSPLRFSNDWNYIFRNEINADILDKSRFNSRKYYSTEVDVLVNDSKDDKPSFYQGILHDYFLDETGNLDRISLSLAKKRVKLDDGTLKLTDIAGDTFIIPYKNISNMNLRYNYVYKEKNNQIPPVIKNAMVIIILLLFILLLIAPWFTSVSFLLKLASIVILFGSWTCLILSADSLLIENPKKPFSISERVLLLLFSLASFFLALYILDVINVIDYIKTCFKIFN